jgi:hypothetical protein
MDSEEEFLDQTNKREEAGNIRPNHLNQIATFQSLS